MSGLAGVVHFDGQPVTRSHLEQMTAAAAHRGPDGTSPWIGQSQDGTPAVGLSHQSLVTTTRPVDEQPLRDERTGLAITFDSRTFEFLTQGTLAR